MMRLLLISIFLCLAAPALAFTPDEKLADSAQEARAQALFTEIRCVVCQGESIAASQAAIAKDMRRMVREQIKDGAADAEIIGFLSSRYGDEVLMQPPLKVSTLPLWLAPLLFLLAGGVVALKYFRRRNV